jgi:translation initiation factor IF-2
VAAYRQEKATAKRTTSAPASLENMFSALTAKNAVIEYPVVIKADVQGSTEAIVNALNNLSNDEIKVRVLQSGVGAITESDVSLAQASGAPIVGFNVRPNAKARELIERHKVTMKYFDVIYHLTEEIAKEMAGIWGPERIETWSAGPRSRTCSPRASATRQRVCWCSKAGSARACSPVSPVRTSSSRSTTIASLRRFKDDVPKSAPGWNAAWSCRTPTTSRPGDHARSL